MPELTGLAILIAYVLSTSALGLWIDPHGYAALAFLGLQIAGGFVGMLYYEPDWSPEGDEDALD